MEKLKQLTNNHITFPKSGYSQQFGAYKNGNISVLIHAKIWASVEETFCIKNNIIFVNISLYIPKLISIKTQQETIISRTGKFDLKSIK